MSFAYDAGGLRTSKTVNGTTYRYYYACGKLMRMTWGSNYIDFFYDGGGTPYAMKYNGTLYYYVTNLQGDVMRVVNASGTVVASYDYDPYGKVISATGTLANVNPLRYRSYVYDQETGFYYLQSRYYDPAIGRFINADSYSSTGQGILGNNMFAYCLNNPISLVDATGDLAASGIVAATNFWNPIGWAAAGVFFLEVLAVVATVAVVNELANSGSQSYTVSKPLGSSYDALSTQSKKNQASKKKQQISIQSGQTTSPMPPKGPNKNYNNKYQGKTLYQDKNVHVDYEYNRNFLGPNYI